LHVVPAYHIFNTVILETRRVTLAGITRHPKEEWMVQMGRNAVDVIDGALLPIRFALHDRDTKFCASFRNVLRSSGVQPILFGLAPIFETSG
jgi:putative transposase